MHAVSVRECDLRWLSVQVGKFPRGCSQVESGTQTGGRMWREECCVFPLVSVRLGGDDIAEGGRGGRGGRGGLSDLRSQL